MTKKKTAAPVSVDESIQASNEPSCKAVEAAVEDFCRQHVHRWLGTFIDQIRANSNDPFYLLMAQVLEFVEPVLLG